MAPAMHDEPLPGVVVSNTGPIVLRVLQGDGQQLKAATWGTPLAVRVSRTGGVAPAGTAVSWRVVSGDATVPAAVTTTNSNGTALSQVKAGRVGGPIVVRAVAGEDSVDFRLDLRVATPWSITITRNDEVMGPVGSWMGPIIATVTDANGAKVAGATVRWNVAVGDAQLSRDSFVTTAGGAASTSVRIGRFIVSAIEASVTDPTGAVHTATAAAVCPWQEVECDMEWTPPAQ